MAPGRGLALNARPKEKAGVGEEVVPQFAAVTSRFLGVPIADLVCTRIDRLSSGQLNEGCTWGNCACDTDVWDYFLRQGPFLVRQGCVVLDSNPWLPIYMRFVQVGFLSCSLSGRVAFA